MATRAERLAAVNAGSTDPGFPDEPDNEKDGFPVESLRNSGLIPPVFSDDPQLIPTRVKVPGATEEEPPARRRTNAKKEAGPEKRVGRTAKERDLADVAEGLEENLVFLFSLMAGLFPTAGVYGVENANGAVDALISIGKRRPVVMKVLMAISEGSDIGTIAKYGFGVAAAVQVDMGRLDPESLPARILGVTEIFNELQEEDSRGEENSQVLSMPAPKHAVFQPV